MLVSVGRTRRQSCRLVSAALLLFVFFLPLHFHFPSGAKVAKECACVQGTRTQLALVASSTACAPIIAIQPVFAAIKRLVSVEWPRRQCVRGPPSALSA